jgi:hypothetical protein
MVRHHIGAVTNIRGAVQAERLLWFFCRWCGHASRFDPRELARMIGRDIQFDELGRRLKCKRCNHKGRALVILSDQRWIGRD